MAHCEPGLRPYLAAPYQPTDLASPAPPLPGGTCPPALRPETFLLQSPMHLAVQRADLAQLCGLLRPGRGDEDDDDDAEAWLEMLEQSMRDQNQEEGEDGAAGAAEAEQPETPEAVAWRLLRALSHADASGCTPLGFWGGKDT